eukprot:CAMPEP_0171828860 /NCGR_PEP_ID=MMETSP0992-20121227/7398_1 /TAXON_ID=483369 /ORGANISM="non described non described, Strain CCMP2098" /LENGTH=171 /DNA_ID=CAMNT_0012444091 /DNA_START=365 /DNA_END=878 /DNA_ORIENTATION=-
MPSFSIRAGKPRALQPNPRDQNMPTPTKALPPSLVASVLSPATRPANAPVAPQSAERSIHWKQPLTSNDTEAIRPDTTKHACTERDPHDAEEAPQQANKTRRLLLRNAVSPAADSLVPNRNHRPHPTTTVATFSSPSSSRKRKPEKAEVGTGVSRLALAEAEAERKVKKHM